MLRSVKRREYQESFDRYCQFVEKKKFDGRKKSLWPPFRLPGGEGKCFEYDRGELISRMDACGLSKDDVAMVGKEREKQERVDWELRDKGMILSTKSLHAVLLTILYEASSFDFFESFYVNY